MINESTLSTADAVPLPQWGRLTIRGCRFSRIVRANTGYVEKKNSDGQSLPRVGKVASEASRIGFQRYEREGGDRLKCVVYESTLSTADAVPLPQWGRQRGGGFAAKKEANPASLRSAAPSKGRGLRGCSLLPMEGGAPKGRRLDGGKRYEKDRGRSSQVCRLREHPSAAERSSFWDVSILFSCRLRS